MSLVIGQLYDASAFSDFRNTYHDFLIVTMLNSTPNILFQPKNTNTYVQYATAVNNNPSSCYVYPENGMYRLIGFANTAAVLLTYFRDDFNTWAQNNISTLFIHQNILFSNILSNPNSNGTNLYPHILITINKNRILSSNPVISVWDYNISNSATLKFWTDINTSDLGGYVKSITADYDIRFYQSVPTWFSGSTIMNIRKIIYPEYNVPSKFYLLGTWDNQGVPSYLTSSDIIEPDLVQRIRLSLPENKPVPTNNPGYLTNTASRNIIIKTSDPDFAGADVWTTFIDEGAGYKNVFGYYVYSLNNNSDIPTKFVNGNWVPYTRDETNYLNHDGKYMLKQYLVFPNSSLRGLGGNMVPGMKVKLLYNPENPNEKFPNNTGVGFFVIPDGFNSYNAQIKDNSRLFSNKEFNPSSNIQTVLFYDTANSDTNTNQLILGFEDIDRTTGGDNDFNDLIVKITMSPSSAQTTDQNLVLSSGITISVTDLISDKTGLYLQFPSSTVNTILGTSATNIGIKQKIKVRSKKYFDMLMPVLENIVYKNNGKISTGTDVDTDGNIISMETIFHFPKNNMKNYIYIMSSIDNKTQISLVDPNVNNIVSYQDLYIFDTDDIIEEVYTIFNYETNDVYLVEPLRPNVNFMITPLAMGDPHITTINGLKYDLIDDKKSFELYHDSNYLIASSLDQYPKNIEDNIYPELLFMNKLLVKNKITNHVDIIDLFNTDDKEYSTVVNINAEQLPKKIYTQHIKNKEKLPKAQFKFYEFNSRDIGKAFIEIIYNLEFRDFINSVTIHLNNMMVSNDIRGALFGMGKFDYKDDLSEFL